MSLRSTISLQFFRGHPGSSCHPIWINARCSQSVSPPTLSSFQILLQTEAATMFKHLVFQTSPPSFLQLSLGFPLILTVKTTALHPVHPLHQPRFTESVRLSSPHPCQLVFRPAFQGLGPVVPTALGASFCLIATLPSESEGPFFSKTFL